MIKKSLMAFSMVACFGLATLFSVNSSDAQVITHEGDKIPCYSAGNPTTGDGWFVACDTCLREDGLHSGAVGECTRN